MPGFFFLLRCSDHPDFPVIQFLLAVREHICIHCHFAQRNHAPCLSFLQKWRLEAPLPLLHNMPNHISFGQLKNRRSSVLVLFLPNITKWKLLQAQTFVSVLCLMFFLNYFSGFSFSFFYLFSRDPLIYSLVWLFFYYFGYLNNIWIFFLKISLSLLIFCSSQLKRETLNVIVFHFCDI